VSEEGCPNAYLTSYLTTRLMKRDQTVVKSGQVPIVRLVGSGSNLGKPLLTLTRPKTG
jgi:hypothetical protein